MMQQEKLISYLPINQHFVNILQQKKQYLPELVKLAKNSKTRREFYASPE